jgi:SAM-dependent methyltransferase
MAGVEPEILAYYQQRRPETTRITTGLGRLEFDRTCEIVGRHLPAPPARVLDVGGAEGVYAAWLASQGYDVEVVDPVPAHVDEARAAGARAGFTARVGDARELDAPEASADVVLLLGPCYHLTDEPARLRALSEARRVVRPGGPVFVAAISRYASLFDGLATGNIFEPRFQAIVERDLAEGQHRNEHDDAHWFTTAYFHHPDELVAEVRSAGLSVRELVGVEGMAAWQFDLAARYDDDTDRDDILATARAV